MVLVSVVAATKILTNSFTFPSNKPSARQVPAHSAEVLVSAAFVRVVALRLVPFAVADTVVATAPKCP